MNLKFDTKTKAVITAVSALIVGVHLLVEYFHGGVVTHYILQDDNLPGLSNWLGLITFPLLVWFTLCSIEKRSNLIAEDKATISTNLYRFLSATIFGVLVSYFFTIESSMLDYMMLTLFILSFFIPLYYGEFLVGFALGTMYIFGPNIPIIGGLVLILIYYLLYSLPRVILRFVKSKSD